MSPYLAAGLPVSFVELDADLPTRLERNSGTDRILAKPSKRDLARSDGNVRSLERFRMATDPAQPSLVDQVIGDHAAAGDDHAGRTDLHLLSDELDGIAARLAGAGFDVTRTMLDDIGPMLTVAAASGARITVSGGSPKGRHR